MHNCKDEKKKIFKRQKDSYLVTNAFFTQHRKEQKLLWQRKAAFGERTSASLSSGRAFVNLHRKKLFIHALQKLRQKT